MLDIDIKLIVRYEKTSGKKTLSSKRIINRQIRSNHKNRGTNSLTNSEAQT